MQTVRLIGGGEPDGEVFVSLEHTPVVLADIRAALPQLKKDLSARWWPIDSVEIENQLPRRRNPVDLTQITRLSVEVACVGILVRFFNTAAQAAAKKVGDVAGDEIGEYVRGWIRRIAQRQPEIHKEKRSQRKCECGCGGLPKGPNSRFLPGHDLRKAYKETVGSSRRTKKG
jgi:hypothetical protein